MSLKYTYIKSQFDPTFCSEIYKKYIDDKTYNESIQIISGHCQSHQLNFTSETFDTNKKTLYLKGQLQLFNTLNALTDIVISEHEPTKVIMKALWTQIQDGSIFDDHLLFNNFAMMMYIDLKKYKFYYWLSFPVFKLPNDVHISKQYMYSELISDEHIRNDINKEMTQLWQKNNNNYYFKLDVEKVELKPLTFDDIKDVISLTLIFNDMGTNDNHPSWCIRNLLFALSYHIKKSLNLTIICYRSTNSPVFDIILQPIQFDNLKFNSLSIPEYYKGLVQSYKTKIKPDIIDMQQYMDQDQLCKSALTMNNKLMKWRIVPDLDLDNISNTKCLIIGGGTLGCHVARNLLGWAITNITFVDYGSVSHSTPAKQSLYFQDDIGKLKMDVISQNFKKIYGDANVKGINLTIPMPDYPINNVKEFEQSIEILHKLYDEHDVIFILTDTRESRWFPTLLGKIHNKPCFTSAIGFDTFVVIRHNKVKNETGDNMACYFCSDIVEPINSTATATMDKKCTVTRAGVSAMASALVSELMISCISCNKNDIDVLTNIPKIPQQIRGNMSLFDTKTHMFPQSSCCIACSDTIVEQYKVDGTQFIKNVIQNRGYLTKLLHLEVDPDVSYDYPEE